MGRQVSKIYQTCAQESFKEENRVCDKNKWDQPVKICIVEEWVEYGNLDEHKCSDNWGRNQKGRKGENGQRKRGNSIKNGVEEAYVIENFRKSGQWSSQWYEGKTGKKNAKFWSILFPSSLWEPE